MTLIVKLGALGDVLRTTSLLVPLRREYKNNISWLTSPEARPLLEGHPDVGEIFTDGRKISRRFDLVLSLEENKQAALRAQKACSGRLTGVILKEGRLTYTTDSAPYYGMSLLNQYPEKNLACANALKAANEKTYAEMWLDILGLPEPQNREDIRPKLFLNAKDREEAQNISNRYLIRAGRAIGFNPGAGKRWPSKELSVGQSRGILRALARLHRPILLLGGKEEERRNKQIAAGFQNVIRSKPLKVRSFAGLIELCGAIVTTDSLAFHLSTALAKNSVVLIGPTSASELDVYGRGKKLLPENGCRCFYLKRCINKISCLEKISPIEIIKAVKNLP